MRGYQGGPFGFTVCEVSSCVNHLWSEIFTLAWALFLSPPSHFLCTGQLFYSTFLSFLSLLLSLSLSLSLLSHPLPLPSSLSLFPLPLYFFLCFFHFLLSLSKWLAGRALCQQGFAKTNKIITVENCCLALMQIQLPADKLLHLSYRSCQWREPLFDVSHDWWNSYVTVESDLSICFKILRVHPAGTVYINFVSPSTASQYRKPIEV